jgi:DEAD/DEAH box helicase domain-containing protein
MPIPEFLQQFRRGEITYRLTPAQEARYAPMPEDTRPELRDALAARGIRQLYIHQRESVDKLKTGRDIVITTGVASGKTLCYNFPVIDAIAAQPGARALYLFPTKALAQDQLSQFRNTVPNALRDRISAETYDGDTPSEKRRAIRENAAVILSNPDMLHAGILPHHAAWAEFFRGLQFVVIDEIHYYRGILGSHVVNVLRRLRRVCRFYGGDPRYILTSATVSGPADHGRRLIEAPVDEVSDDGSPHGERFFLLYNPPLVNAELGIRRNSLLESVRLGSDLIHQHLASIIFANTRRAVELALSYLQRSGADDPERLKGYRSGYLPKQRREIEQALRDGEVSAVVATNALELGVDIGDLDASILVGYPGSIASVKQQAGRAGRRNQASLALMIASANPLDQFLAAHPDYFFGRSPEHPLVDPENPIILLQHVQCAVFELPFHDGEAFGEVPAGEVDEILSVLRDNGAAYRSGDRTFWMADRYPAEGVSLRNATPKNFTLHDRVTGQAIGKVDYNSGFWMAHPNAIYLHEGRNYIVKEFDYENAIVRLDPTDTDYYTEPISESRVFPVETREVQPFPSHDRSFGDILLKTRVTGYRQVKWYTRENLGINSLDLPSVELHTQGAWLTLSEDSLRYLREEGLFRGDPNNYGPGWGKLQEMIRERDGYVCTVCGAPEKGRAHDVHHIKPFRAFATPEAANAQENLTTLCSSCHRLAEANVKMQSGLAGLAHLLRHLAPLYLMCDSADLGVIPDQQCVLGEGRPTLILHDQVPGGIGLSRKAFGLLPEMLENARGVIRECACAHGCPSCTGPAPEMGGGGKKEALAMLEALLDERDQG